MARSRRHTGLLLALALLLGPGARGAAPPARPFVLDPPTPADESAGGSFSKEGAPEAAAAEEPTFHPRGRHALNWILSRGQKRFDVIEWVSRPDLLTLGDLAFWPAECDYDLDLGINFNIRWWAGPKGDADTPVPDLPPRVYDLDLRLTWRQRWADGIATEVTLLPGLYTDFRTTPPDAFRVPGFAVGVFRVAPELHLVAGAWHLQRLRVKALPIAGLLWEPTDRWQCRLVFPEPKVSYRLDAKHDAWVYARGEYGGGTWAYKDNAGRADLVEYSDLRVGAGFEWGSLTRAFCPKVPLGTGFIEVGYVFDRQLVFDGPTPPTGVPPGWMISLGSTW
jgi:hypothetical protein